MFSNSSKYAIRAVLYLALKSDESNKLKSEYLAQVLDIPKHFLAKILQQLTKQKIISSLKGRNGGFYLTDENRATNLLSVVEAIEGPVSMNSCILGLDHCSDEAPCPFHFSVSKFKYEFYFGMSDESIDSCSKRIDFSKLTLINSQKN